MNMPPMKIAYLDKPGQDAKGLVRRFPSLASSDEPLLRPLRVDPTCIEFVNTPGGLAQACESLRSASLLGFDLEWRAPMQRGESPGKVALLQLSTGARTVVIDLFTIGSITPPLANLLITKRLAG